MKKKEAPFESYIFGIQKEPKAMFSGWIDDIAKTIAINQNIHHSR
jgi:hypothetical protein